MSQVRDCVTAQCGSSQYPQIEPCSLQSLQSSVVRASDQLTEGCGFKSYLGLGFFRVYFSPRIYVISCCCCCFSNNREFKIWRRQRQRQRHKSMIWLVEWREIIVLHVRHAFWCNVMTWSAKRRREIFIFQVLTTTRARSSTEIFNSLPLHENLSYQASESAICVFCTTWSTWNNRKRFKLMQSWILMWRFRFSCRRSFLNSLI